MLKRSEIRQGAIALCPARAELCLSNGSIISSGLLMGAEICQSLITLCATRIEFCLEICNDCLTGLSGLSGLSGCSCSCSCSCFGGFHG